MGSRVCRVREGSVRSCPRCGNGTDFVAKSSQVAEDGCEVWIECKCGYDPHTDMERLETPMGRLDRDNVVSAFGCWNAAADNRKAEQAKETQKQEIPDDRNQT